MALPFSRSAMPTARWYTTSPLRAATTTAPTICCCARALSSTASRRLASAVSVCAVPACAVSACAASARAPPVLAALARITAGPPGHTARAATSVTKTARPRSLPAHSPQHFNVIAMLPPWGHLRPLQPAPIEPCLAAQVNSPSPLAALNNQTAFSYDVCHAGGYHESTLLSHKAQKSDPE